MEKLAGGDGVQCKRVSTTDEDFGLIEAQPSPAQHYKGLNWGRVASHPFSSSPLSFITHPSNYLCVCVLIGIDRKRKRKGKGKAGREGLDLNSECVCVREREMQGGDEVSIEELASNLSTYKDQLHQVR